MKIRRHGKERLPAPGRHLFFETNLKLYNALRDGQVIDVPNTDIDSVLGVFGNMVVKVDSKDHKDLDKSKVINQEKE